MEWTPQQARAIDAVHAWYRDPNGPQVFRVFGWAGTGKSTLAKHFTEGISGDVRFGTYTGKAASVLQSKGLPTAQTLHSLIYTTKEKSAATLKLLEAELLKLLEDLQEYPLEEVDQHPQVLKLRAMIAQERRGADRLFFSLNHDSDLQHAKLLVVDEVSMVDETMGMDLESFGKKILVLGDPFQLPPVGGGGYWTEQKPDVMLTEVRRQALDSPVLQLATAVREGRSLRLGRYGESSVRAKGSVTPEEALGAQQILVGRNRTRTATNNRVRSLLGVGGLPTAGEKLVCLRNNRELGLYNGTVWVTMDTAKEVSEDRMLVRIRPEEGGEAVETQAHRHYVEGREAELGWYEKKEADALDYGYALTVHKSQGSQWDDVLLFDESSAFREHAARWLYTGITRAARSVTVVQNG
jgi:exodeoxyribonuclease-5